MGNGTQAEVAAYGPPQDDNSEEIDYWNRTIDKEVEEYQSQQQFEAEVQQWEREEREVEFIRKAQKSREFSDWWQALDKDTDYIKEHDDASNGRS